MDKWLAMIDLIAPAILTAVGGERGADLAPIAKKITHGIKEAQQIKGASGKDKRAHVLAIAADAIDTENTIANRQVLDPALTLETVGHGIDAVIGSVNIAQGTHTAVAVPAAV